MEAPHIHPQGSMDFKVEGAAGEAADSVRKKARREGQAGEGAERSEPGTVAKIR